MTVEGIRYPDAGLLDAPETGIFSAAPRARVYADLPQPLPIEERVFPPRRPDVPPAPVADSTPAPAPTVAPRGSGRRPGISLADVRLPRRRRGPRRKSVVGAALLGFVLGPLGLLYLGFRQFAAAVVVLGSVVVLTVAVGLAVSDVGSTLMSLLVEALLLPPASAAWGSAGAWWRNRTIR